jgi:hypothetical protein
MNESTRSNMTTIYGPGEAHSRANDHLVGMVCFLAVTFACVSAALCSVIPHSAGAIAAGALCILWLGGLSFTYLREFL